MCNVRVRDPPWQPDAARTYKKTFPSPFGLPSPIFFSLNYYFTPLKLDYSTNLDRKNSNSPLKRSQKSPSTTSIVWVPANQMLLNPDLLLLNLNILIRKNWFSDKDDR